MASIELRELTKVYPNGARALDALSLEVKEGEWLALVGPSGCGKTTTLRLIAGLETPTSGTIRFNGKDVAALPPARRDVALVFQRPALYPHLTVAENLAFSLRLAEKANLLRRLGALLRRRVPASDAVVNSVARQLDLEPLLERRPAELSGGQQQRVALGRALVRRPGILLLDEPLSHLDQPLRAELRRQLHLLRHAFPATMIYVTHDPVEAVALGDRVAVLAHGRLQQVDRPALLVEGPVNRAVAALVSEAPLSFLDGELAQEQDRLWFMIGDLRLAVPPLRRSWTAHVGKPLTLGVRADDVEVDSTADESGCLLRLEWVEPRGSVSLVGLALEGDRGTLLTIAGTNEVERMKPGQKIVVRCNLERALLLDRVTGQNLDAARSSG